MLERLGSTHRWSAGSPANAPHVGRRLSLRSGTRVALEAEVAVPHRRGGAVAGIAPAFEIVNYSTPAGSFEEVLAHDLFHDAVVLGRQTFAVPIADDTWPHVTRNGAEVARRDPDLLVLPAGADAPRGGGDARPIWGMPRDQ